MKPVHEVLIDALALLDEGRAWVKESAIRGPYCALGAIGKARGVRMAELDPDDHDTVATAFGVAGSLVREIMFENDEGGASLNVETPEQRWQRMRTWVAKQTCGKGTTP